MNIPIAADLLSKSAMPENHPLYLGVYGGAMSSDEHVRKYVESSDCVLMLGTFITDMSMGFYTAKLDREEDVLATTERVNVQYHRYESMQFRDFLAGSLAKATIRRNGSTSQSARRSQAVEKGGTDRSVDHASMFSASSRCISMKTAASSPTSATRFSARSVFAARDRRSSSRRPITCRWASPCPRASALPWPRTELRPYVLVGDGAFQMTGTEISTAVRLGLNPIIFVLNNDGYGTMRRIHDGKFNMITQWNYDKICELVGGGEPPSPPKANWTKRSRGLRDSGKLARHRSQNPA